jgi:transmembrane 9 superfamily protein 2/4
MVILTNVYEFNQVPIYTNQMKGVLFFLLLVILSLAAPWSQNFYQKGQEVEIKVRKLFSKQNLPQDFYSLPFCRPKKRTMSSQSLGEIFFGDRIDSSPFVRVNMLEQISCRRIDKFVDTGCTIPEEQGCTRVEMECPTVAHDDIAKFIKMIRDNYEAQLIVDSLPVANIQKVMNHTVGDHPDTHSKDHSHVYLKPDGFPIGCSNSAKTEYYINNHLTFHIKYYQDKRYPEQYYVVGVGVIPASIKHTINSCREDQPLSANLKKLVLDPEEEDMKIPFSYSIEWEESDIQYASRWDSYLYVQDPKEMRIHWLSIFNSFAVVLFLSGAIAMILLRILRKDIAAYNDEEDMDNQTGWKVLHGDIFRKPTFSTLFSITVGSGAQVFGMFFITLVLSVGFLSPSNRGSVVTLMVVFYAFIGFFGGYTSLRMYRFFGGESWKWVSFFTAAFFPGMIFAVFMLVNSIIWLTTTSTISLPVLAVAQMVAIWIFCSLPLVMLGGYFGFHIGEGITVPVRSKTKIHSKS